MKEKNREQIKRFMIECVVCDRKFEIDEEWKKELDKKGEGMTCPWCGGWMEKFEEKTKQVERKKIFGKLLEKPCEGYAIWKHYKKHVDFRENPEKLIKNAIRAMEDAWIKRITKVRDELGK